MANNKDDSPPNEVATESPASDREGGDWLDREHQARVTAVASCDTKEGRKAAAEAEMGRLTEEMQELEAELGSLGGDEHVDAISRSGWFPYRPAIARAARLVWILDIIFWTVLWVGILLLWARSITND